MHNKFNEKSNDDEIGGNYNLQLKDVLNIGPSGCASFQYDFKIKTIEENGKLNIHVPDVYTNQHIFNQQGVFCILEDDFSKKYGETVTKSILKVSHVYRIPKKLRNGILMELEALGIDEIHLFQDIKGLVDHAKIKLSWANSNDKT